MLTKLWIAVIVTSALVYTNDAYNILVIFPFPGPSHGILGNGYVDNLLNAGHEVTYITPFPRKDPPAKLHQIKISYPDKFVPNKYFNLEALMNKTMDMSTTNFKLLYTITRHFLTQEPVQQFINDPKQTFDLVIVEWMYTDLYAGFGPLFQCPLIWSSSVDPHWIILRLIDEAPNPAYVADMKSNNMPPFTFMQRVEELWTQLKVTFLMWRAESFFNPLYDEVFVAAGKNRGIAVPPLHEVLYNASFVISNCHISLGEPVKLPQNFIPVAGYHIDTKPKPLPEDIQKIMDNSKDGVIYFSMGSNLRSSDLPLEMKQNFLKVFGKLKQTVFWKIDDVLPDIPQNVHILKWAPQQSILAHPNCVLFITHGGILSTTETVHFGVPIIGIPVIADQFINVNRAVNRGIARRVDLSLDTPKELEVAIQDILTNPSYREKVKFYSAIYHDRPVPPGKEIVHWAEHAIKTRGAPHFRSRALELSWYQKMYLDLVALIAVMLFGLCFTLKRLFKSKKNTSQHKKKE